eukprot:TRINITY_DN1212_c0_g1_i2.p1 TRINITY_DN1212_c0_g1~~TRINITY_DN1212_c0_g1_i2.p1  ORF type:complete len:397 (+),score=78.94 TRINITY_DN1212_c0_g1_i2:24-1193(+)
MASCVLPFEASNPPPLVCVSPQFTLKRDVLSSPTSPLRSPLSLPPRPCSSSAQVQFWGGSSDGSLGVKEERTLDEQSSFLPLAVGSLKVEEPSAIVGMPRDFSFSYGISDPVVLPRDYSFTVNAEPGEGKEQEMVSTFSLDGARGSDEALSKQGGTDIFHSALSQDLDSFRAAIHSSPADAQPTAIKSPRISNKVRSAGFVKETKIVPASKLNKAFLCLPELEDSDAKHQELLEAVMAVSTPSSRKFRRSSSSLGSMGHRHGGFAFASGADEKGDDVSSSSDFERCVSEGHNCTLHRMDALAATPRSTGPRAALQIVLPDANGEEQSPPASVDSMNSCSSRGGSNQPGLRIERSSSSIPPSSPIPRSPGLSRAQALGFRSEVKIVKQQR